MVDWFPSKPDFWFFCGCVYSAHVTQTFLLLVLDPDHSISFCLGWRCIECSHLYFNRFGRASFGRHNRRLSLDQGATGSRTDEATLSDRDAHRPSSPAYLAINFDPASILFAFADLSSFSDKLPKSLNQSTLKSIGIPNHDDCPFGLQTLD